MAHTLGKLNVNVEPGGEFQIELLETCPLTHILTLYSVLYLQFTQETVSTVSAGCRDCPESRLPVFAFDHSLAFLSSVVEVPQSHGGVLGAGEKLLLDLGMPVAGVDDGCVTLIPRLVQDILVTLETLHEIAPVTVQDLYMTLVL